MKKIKLLSFSAILIMSGIVSLALPQSAKASSTLSNLTIDQGVLNPTFDSGTTNYTALVTYQTDSINVTPTATDTGTIEVNGTSVTSGNSISVDLSIGSNTITIDVTDGTTTTYTISVGRESLFIETENSPRSSLPNGSLAFDGVNMWTANGGWDDNINVTKFPPSGQPITYSGTGNYPYDLAFDGTNMWTANVGDSSVTKISPTGEMATYSLLSAGGQGPHAIVFDGTNIWTANLYNDSVTKIAPDGSATNYSGTGYLPNDIAFDGISSIWTTNEGSNSVTKIDVSTGAIVATYPLGFSPWGIVSDGTNMWVTSWENNSVTKISPTGDLTTYYGTGDGPYHISFDGTNIWTANLDGNSVTKILPNGDMVTYPGIDISTIASDGINIWGSNYYYITKISYAEPSFLNNLSIDQGRLTPNFVDDTFNYTATVPYTVKNINITPTAKYKEADIVVNGVAVDSGDSINVSLDVGDNTINVVVTGLDASVSNYTVVVTRENLVGVMRRYPGTGIYPGAIAYDGSGNMWTVNYYSSSVTKVPQFGGIMTQYYGTDSGPLRIGFDGNNMWTVNWDGHSVTKVSPEGIMTNYELSSDITPLDIACDGTNMWTANSNNSVTKISPTGEITTYPGEDLGPNGQSYGIAFDGENMWKPNVWDNSVSKILPDGSMVHYHGTGEYPYSIAFDGTNMWTANSSDNSVTKISPTGEMTNYEISIDPNAITFDGVNIWITSYWENSMVKILPDGTEVRYSLTTGAGPEDIAFDGTSLWTSNAGDNSVIKTTFVVPSSDASLIDLSIGQNTLDPIFASDNFNYTASTESSNINITPTANDLYASITVNGIQTDSGFPVNVDLNLGENIINITVGATDGVTSSDYQIIITRVLSPDSSLNNLSINEGTLDPVFNSETLNYTANVSNSITSLNVTPTTNDSNATITINGDSVDSGDSFNVSLDVGENTIEVAVTAEDGVAISTYLINITRAPYVRYWIGNGGNWDDTEHWSETSGGIGGASIPDSNIDVVFDENSFTTTGQSILFPAIGSDSNVLLLNFTGENGSTSWTEESQGLEPLMVQNSQIDSNSLNMSPGGILAYDIGTPLEGDMNLQYSFSFNPFSAGVSYMVFGDMDGGAMFYLVFGYNEDERSNLMYIMIRDRENNMIAEETLPLPSYLIPNTEHQAEISIVGRDVIITINDNIVGSYTDTIDNPMAGTNVWEAMNGLDSNFWIDDVALGTTAPSNYSKSWDMTNLAYPITMDSEDGTSPWELSIADGTVEVYNTTLINSQAIGGAIFNALISNGNVDGGNNSGWYFGESSSTSTISLNDINDIDEDSLKLELTVDPAHANQELDFRIKIRNEDKDETDYQTITQTTDADGKVTLSIDDLDSNTDYELSVQYSEHEANTFSDYSNSKSATTDDAVDGDECVPSKLSATAISSSQINITWNDNCDTEEGFYLERKTDGGSYEKIGELGKNDESFSDTNLTPNTTYTYRIRAYEGDDESDYSDTVSATTLRTTTAYIAPTVVPVTPPATTTPTTTTSPTTTKTTTPVVTKTQPTAPAEKESKLEQFFADKNVQIVATIAEVIGLLAGVATAAAAAAVPLFPLSQTPFSDFFSGFISRIGFASRYKGKNEWGTVFDAETRGPIPDVKISIINQDGKTLDSVLTDEMGRYGFLPKDGTYILQVNKNNYVFKKDEKKDELYGDIYTGKNFEIKQNEVIKMNIALQATNVIWKEFANRKIDAYGSIFSIVKKDLFAILFYTGFIATLAMIYFSPKATVLNAAILTIYVIMFIYRIFFKTKSFGIISNKFNKPVPFSMVSLYALEDPAKRVAFTATDVLGRYYLLVKDGYYNMKVQGQELNGESFIKTMRVYAKRGIIKEDVRV